MFWERKFERWIEALRAKVEIPLRLTLWDGRNFSFSKEPPRVTVQIPTLSALRYLLTPSLASLGRAYVEGSIVVHGKAADIIALANIVAAHTLEARGRFGRLAHSAWHNRRRDAEAVRYHYDVSNDFYAQWLDENMVYSCGYFENGDEDLASAQLQKIDHILTKIRLRPGATLLDIGCGWGALVLRAAEKFGANCVGITLSQNQFEAAQERVRRAGLERQIEIRLQDYRDVTGSFDCITSVGMCEHVGIRHLPEYFSKINSLLAEHGVALNHGITSTDVQGGDVPYGGGEFVERYVFPNGELPHIGRVLTAMQEGGLEALDVENLRPHYARTCSMWLERFEARHDALQNFADEKTLRIWGVFLAGSAYAFNRDWISLHQVLCTRAGRDGRDHPLSRRYMYQPRAAS